MKFQLKNVGKIKDAEFEIKPLTVFIGANGSGKTYAASALWGVAEYCLAQFTLFSGNQIVNDFITLDSNQSLNKKIESAFSTLFDEVETKIVLSHDEIICLYNYFNEILIKNSSKILTKTFNFKAFDESQLNLHSEINSIEIDIFWNSDDNFIDLKEFNKEKQKHLVYKFTINKNYKLYNINIDKILAFNEFLYSKDYFYIKQSIVGLLLNLFYSIILELLGASKFLYIPAARTGLMFITHDIIQNQFEQSNNFYNFDTPNKRNTNDLTAPLNDFIAKIHNASRPKAQFSSENEDSHLNQLMGGKLVQREGQYRFDFQPNGLEQSIPLAASSSLVTELAALSALADDIRRSTFIILEEPEAHLHLSAQREMAKLIVRLIKEKGCRVLLTTHSDTFLQQINNLIMLEKLAHTNENVLADFGIQADEVIAADDVAVYDFQCVGNETRVENLVCGDYGFVAKSMNEVLIALANETQAIIEQIDDLED